MKLIYNSPCFQNNVQVLNKVRNVEKHYINKMSSSKIAKAKYQKRL